MGRTVLIDADILAYQIAVGEEGVYEFNGQHVLHADLEKGCSEVENAVAWIIDHVDADQAALFVTGDTVDNFRVKVLPSYKGNRKDVRRPMILQGLKDYMKDNFRCFHEKILEADDLIGIHATMPHKGERVIYSADKDLKTVPGLHWDPEDGEVVEINHYDANAFFYEQILTGDAVDNYKGCPGIGPVKAKRILAAAAEGDGDPWPAIVDTYEAKGLTEKDALVQARCARILRHGEYNFDTQEVNLWTP